MTSIPLIPVANDAVTIRSATCPVCSRPFPPRGRGIYCSSACRQQAFRARTIASSIGPAKLPPGIRVREISVYQCPTCGERQLGEIRCEDCNSFCKSLGPGLDCPECGALLVLNELLEELGLPAISLARR